MESVLEDRTLCSVCLENPGKDLVQTTCTGMHCYCFTCISKHCWSKRKSGIECPYCKSAFSSVVVNPVLHLLLSNRNSEAPGLSGFKQTYPALAAAHPRIFRETPNSALITVQQIIAYEAYQRTPPVAPSSGYRIVRFERFACITINSETVQTVVALVDSKAEALELATMSPARFDLVLVVGVQQSNTQELGLHWAQVLYQHRPHQIYLRMPLELFLAMIFSDDHTSGICNEVSNIASSA